MTTTKSISKDKSTAPERIWPWSSEPWHLAQTLRWQAMVTAGWTFGPAAPKYDCIGMEMTLAGLDGWPTEAHMFWVEKYDTAPEQVHSKVLELCEGAAARATPKADIVRPGCVEGEPMRHGPRSYRWRATHDSLMLRCESMRPDQENLVNEESDPRLSTVGVSKDKSLTITDAVEFLREEARKCAARAAILKTADSGAFARDCSMKADVLRRCADDLESRSTATQAGQSIKDSSLKADVRAVIGFAATSLILFAHHRNVEEGDYFRCLRCDGESLHGRNAATGSVAHAKGCPVALAKALWLQPDPITQPTGGPQTQDVPDALAPETELPSSTESADFTEDQLIAMETVLANVERVGGLSVKSERVLLSGLPDLIKAYRSLVPLSGDSVEQNKNQDQG